jgi:hypothetical protein
VAAALTLVAALTGSACGGGDAASSAFEVVEFPNSEQKYVVMTDSQVRDALDGLPYEIEYRAVPHDGTLVVGDAGWKDVSMPFAVVGFRTKYDARLFPKGSGFIEETGLKGMTTMFPTAHGTKEEVVRLFRMMDGIDDALCRARFGEPCGWP